MRYLSVCSGVEAASLAWEPLGWQPVAFSEIDPFACDLLAHRFPRVPNWGDMTRYKEWPDAAVDLLVGGTPCQSFSVAGLRKGLDDPRGNLMLVYGAIARRYRPRWLVWENVPGVLSSNSGRDFGAFLGMLGELRYGFAYRVLDAQHFGLAQRRQRVFVVGCLGDWRSAAAVLFERASLSGHPAPSRQEGQGVAGTLTARAGRNGGGANGEVDGGRRGGIQDQSGADGLVAYGGNNTAGPIDVATACRAKGGSGHGDFESETFIAHTLRGDGFDASEDGTGMGTPLVPVAFDTTQITSAANRSNPKPGDPGHPPTASGDAPAIAFDCKASGSHGFGVGETASTLRAMGRSNGRDNGGGQLAALTQRGVRRLTPTECERLQGFPDAWTAIRRGRKRKPAKDGPRYKAIGNSMAVPCMRWIGRRIDAVAAISGGVAA